MRSTLALGTYRCRNVSRAAEFAAAAGVRWFDTAPNYAGGEAQKQLAPILALFPEIGVSTKVGFLSEQVAQAARGELILSSEAVSRGYSLDPHYIAWQVERSRSEMGRTEINTVLLHNPERLGDGDRNAMHREIRRAFLALEFQAALGHIDGYGVATWSGFTDDAFTVEELLNLASQAASGRVSAFTTVQLPVSLVHLDPLAQAARGHGPVVEARRAGLEVLSSAPLHGGELPDLATKELAELIRPGLSTAAACLYTVASCPGVSRVLLSASSTAHWQQAVDVFNLAPLDQSHLREITDVLAPC